MGCIFICLVTQQVCPHQHHQVCVTNVLNYVTLLQVPKCHRWEESFSSIIMSWDTCHHLCDLSLSKSSVCGIRLCVMCLSVMDESKRRAEMTDGWVDGWRTACVYWRSWTKLAPSSSASRSLPEMALPRWIQESRASWVPTTTKPSWRPQEL